MYDQVFALPASVYDHLEWSLQADLASATEPAEHKLDLAKERRIASGNWRLSTRPSSAGGLESPPPQSWIARAMDPL